MTAIDSSTALPARRSHRLLLFGLLFVGLSAAGLYAIYSQFAGHTLQFDQRLLSAPVLTAVAALLVVYFAADGLRLYYTLRALGHQIPAAAMTRLVFINIFFSNVTPMATGGGFAQIWYLRRQGVALGTATAATTIRTVLAVVFIFSAAPVALLGLEMGVPAIDRLAPYLALFIGVYVAFFTLVLLRPRWLLLPLELCLRGLRRLHLLNPQRYARWHYRLRRELLRFTYSFGWYLRGPRRYIALSVLSTAVFLLSLFSFPALLLWGLDYQFDYFQILGLLVVTTFLMYFAPTPGASGIAEGVFARLFAAVVAAPHLVLVTLGWRFLTIHLGVLIGLVITQIELSRGGGGDDPT